MKAINESVSRQMLSKVPEVTALFWIIKILATTVGETAADFLNFNLHFGLVLTTGIMGAFFIIALAVQMRALRYKPVLYWTTVVLISVFGTLVTDNLVDNLKVPLEVTTIAFAGALIATFGAWYASEKTLSIHSITTTKREGFYWAAILVTFALGTAAGDLAAEAMKLGYAVSAFLFAAAIVLVMAAYYLLGFNPIASFWIAYVLTRPFGASLGDFLSQPASNGGLGLGTLGTSAIFLIIILGLIAVLSKAESNIMANAQPGLNGE